MVNADGWFKGISKSIQGYVSVGVLDSPSLARALFMTPEGAIG
jgi:hypothetical protein